VDDVNNEVLEMLPGEAFAYLSADGFKPGDEHK
jgi:hypothetical protein